MKKSVAVAMAALMTASIGMTAMAAAEGDITVVSREDGSVQEELSSNCLA